MTGRLIHPGTRRHVTRRFIYLTGAAVTGYGAVRDTVITFDERRGQRTYYCSECGRVIPVGTPHLADRNGSTTRIHLDCGEVAL